MSSGRNITFDANLQSILQYFGATVMPKMDVSHLDAFFFDENGRLKIHPAEELRKIAHLELMAWANGKGIYCVPSTELIDWLRQEIRGRKAIEICAGNGAIARALGIPATDSYMQTDEVMSALYKVMGQKPIEPPKDVYKFEANDAVDHFKPKVVIGAYVTQKYQDGDEGPPKINSSLYGVDELSLLPKVERYITIGNELSHGDKRLRKLPHRVYQFDWVFTRSAHPQMNNIVVWDNVS